LIRHSPVYKREK